MNNYPNNISASAKMNCSINEIVAVLYNQMNEKGMVFNQQAISDFNELNANISRLGGFLTDDYYTEIGQG